MSPVGTARLAVRMLAFRWRSALVIFFAGLIAAAPVVGLAAVRTSAMNAVLNGIVGDRGYSSGYVMQASSKRAAQALAQMPDVTPVATAAAQVSTSTALVQGDVAVQGNAKTWLQHLTEGRRPVDGSEVTLSKYLAYSLSVGIGDIATIQLPNGEHDLRVVGLTVDPAHRTDASAVTVMADFGGLSPNQWLVPHPPKPQVSPEVISLLNQRSIRASSTRGAFADAKDNPPAVVDALRFMPWGVGFLLTVLALAAMYPLWPAAKRDANALMGARLSTRRSWRVVIVAAAIPAVCGVAAGTGLAAAVLHVGRGSVSSSLGQDWLHVSIPLAPVLIMLIVPIVLSLAARPTIRVASRARSLLLVPRLHRKVAIVAACMAAALGLALITYLSLRRQDLRPSAATRLALLGTVLVAASLPLVLAPLLRMRAGNATRRSAAHVSAQFAVAAAVGLVIASATGGYAAITIHNANAVDRLVADAGLPTPQPRGSLLIDGLSEHAALKLQSLYRQLGGSNAVAYEIATARKGVPRVTTPEIARCLTAGQRLDACAMKSANTTVSVIGLSSSVQAGSPRAARDVVRDGQVGILIINRERPTIVVTHVARATADSTLGGNLPGLVVSPRGPLVTGGLLRHSGHFRLALFDFRALSAKNAGRFRGSMARLAPAAQVAEDSAESLHRQEISLARTVSLTGAGLVALVLLVGSAAVMAGNRRLRRVLPALGADIQTRVVMALRIFPVAAISALLSGLLIPWAVAAAGVHASGSLGWVWIAPLVTVAVASAVPVIVFVLVPHRVRE